MKNNKDVLLGIFCPLFYYFTLHLAMCWEYSEKYTIIIGVLFYILLAVPGIAILIFLTQKSVKEFFKSLGVFLLVSLGISLVWNVLNIDFLIYTSITGYDEFSLGEGVLMIATTLVYIQVCTVGCIIAGIASLCIQKKKDKINKGEIKMFTKKDLMEQLENNFKHIQGKIVTVHTSLKAVGEIEGGGDTLLSALVEFFTKDGGILCLPTHTWNSTVFDRRTNESCTGVMSKLAAARPDCTRTLHPTHSLGVFGDKEKVEWFVSNEATADTTANPKGCYGKLLEEDGYVLLIGVGQNKNTFIHCVEEMLEVPGRLTDFKVERTIIHEDGTEETKQLYWFDSKIPDVSVYFTKFELPFRYHGCIEDAYIGNAKVQICNSTKMYRVIKDIYEKNNFGELLDNDLPIDEKLYK